eukprot:CAMPEP_0183708276 /NCGR_PEP_ID=MMETSP0737-20130205/4636_1 /TAXON_ID=385413 /ORGANISM="Thalassiosira miniscula, Strain CCMP1093" /LENGTH=307 /DNA_ID=CAMNT_0025936119 /DNA_START=88 /DNA_END=1008 /DNA_ORIENTATION=+
MKNTAKNGAETAERKKKQEVFIFLDVDGVLNTKWIGYIGQQRNNSSPSLEDETKFHPRLVDNFANLIHRLENHPHYDLDPKIVLSTTWRLQEQSCKELVSFLSTIQVGTKKLGRYLNNFDDNHCDNEKERRSFWSTPDLDHGTTPEGRAAEIQAWVRHHCQTNNVKQNDLLFLILDDLDLLYTDTGKRNESIQQQNFVCTVSYKSHRQVEGEVGLTKERVEIALQKVQEQCEMMKRRKEGTGIWTKDEWELLSNNVQLRPHLQALRSDDCPSWILDIARSHVKREQQKQKQQNGNKGNYLIALGRRW